MLVCNICIIVFKKVTLYMAFIDTHDLAVAINILS